jgi:dynein intermediate chain 1
MRERGVSTEPPPVVQFAATVTSWEIYDSYMESVEATLREREAEASKRAALVSEEKDGLGGGAGGGGSSGHGDERGKAAGGGGGREEDVIHSAAMGASLKVLERMVNQNAEDEIFQDFKYWEDQSDQFREGEGSLLPLWRFSTDRTKRKQVTSLAWNPAFPDLFAVGYGSYDFMRQGSGLICCFSLKNTSHPEYTFSTECGVLCLHFHPQHHALLAVGCYDGTVMVYDVRNKVNKPIYVSSIKTGKHTDPVWQVVWQEADIAKELNFFSISSDGRVANWIMSKNTEFKMEPAMLLKVVSAAKDEPDEETSLAGYAGGCCFDFNTTSEHLFIVGTEEGKIHKCSKAYSGQYLETYEGHHMAVYAVKWNPYHPRVFVSCSADWTVKLWDHNVPSPIISFDLFNAVGDVAWAPYSSTVFAAVTSDGKVHVYDLHENKHEPLCEQKVVKRARLTHVAFNQRDPVLLVGDDRGGVTSLKLSPNLRKLVEPTEEKTKLMLEVDKMDKLLAAADTRGGDKQPPASAAST